MVALRLGVDELGGLGHLSGPAHVRIADVRPAELQVGGDVPREQDPLLGHIAHQRARLVLAQISDVYPVQGDAALAHVEEPGDQVDEGGFASAVEPMMAVVLPGSAVKVMCSNTSASASG